MSICQAVATNGSAGRRIRRETNEPYDHEIVAPSMSASPIAAEPPPAPGTTTSASPASPASTLNRVAGATRSRTSVRSAITCSGTVPAIIAATLESIRVSATVTMPTQDTRSAAPTEAAAASSARVTRTLAPFSASTAARIAPAAAKRRPADNNGGKVRTDTLIAR